MSNPEIRRNAPDAAPAGRKPQSRPCACSCGGHTRRLFAPGHDARLVSQLGDRVAAGELTVQEATEQARLVDASLLLLAKLTASAERKLRDVRAKAQRATERAERKANPKPRKPRKLRIRVGRWEYDATDVGDGDLEYADAKGNTRRVHRDRVQLAAA